VQGGCIVRRLINRIPKMSDHPDIEEITTKELAGHTLFGKALEPYSESRQIAAQAMGLQFPFVGDEGWARLAKDSPYAGAITDAAIVCWLCSVLPLEVDRACASPAWARGEAMRWAIENKSTRVTQPNFKEAFNVALTIIRNEMDTDFEVATDSGRGASIIGGESPLL
jgi:hypothetical protein